MTFIEPLNIEYLLVNTFAGSAEIFLLLAGLFIASMAAYFRMPNIITVVMFVIFFFMLLGTSLAGAVTQYYVLLIVVLVGLATYYIFAKMFK